MCLIIKYPAHKETRRLLLNDQVNSIRLACSTFYNILLSSTTILRKTFKNTVKCNDMHYAMKYSFSNPFLWEEKYPRIAYSHKGAADTGENSTSVDIQLL